MWFGNVYPAWFWVNSWGSPWGYWGSPWGTWGNNWGAWGNNWGGNWGGRGTMHNTWHR